LVYVPSNYSDFFFDKLLGDNDYSYQKGWLTVLCDEDAFDDVYILIDNYWL